MSRKLTSRLLIVVNLTLVVLLGISTGLQIGFTSRNLLREKRNDLVDEAKTLMPAALRSKPAGKAILESLAESVCRRMSPSEAPGHHVVIVMNSLEIQGDILGAGHREPIEKLEAACGSSTGTAGTGDAAVIVGKATEGGVTIYVSEALSPIQRIIRTTIAGRLASLVALMAALAVVINWALRRMLQRPLQNMVQVVRRFSEGDAAARMPSPGTDELGLLAGEFNRMAADLENAKEERRSLLRKARRIQENLLTPVSDIRDFRVSFLFQPAAEVSGDYYDVLKLGEDQWLLCLSDVSGHDVPAAMGAAMLKALLLVAVERETDPSKLIGIINDAFCRAALPEDFATLIIARWERASRTLSFSGAGHESAYVIRHAGEILELPSSGLPVGATREEKWATTVLTMNQGDHLVMMTDGLADTLSPEHEAFGRSRLAVALDRLRAEPLELLPTRLSEEAAMHRGQATQDDDITIVAAEF